MPKAFLRPVYGLFVEGARMSAKHHRIIEDVMLVLRTIAARLLLFMSSTSTSHQRRGCGIWKRLSAKRNGRWKKILTPPVRLTRMRLSTWGCGLGRGFGRYAGRPD